MTNKDYHSQLDEYENNKNDLESIIKNKVVSASYPCNSYNIDTLNCMEKLDIQIGFRANMEKIYLKKKNLELPREDHANIIKKMRDYI